MKTEILTIIAVLGGFLAGVAFQMKIHTPTIRCVDYRNKEFQAVQRETFVDAYYYGAQALISSKCESFQKQLSQDSTTYFKILYGTTKN